MRLTRKKAIQLSIELWTWLAETGNSNKAEWPGWMGLPHMISDCALCEYSGQQLSTLGCGPCPYYQKFGVCFIPRSPYNQWEAALTPGRLRKTAAQFLVQLKQL